MQNNILMQNYYDIIYCMDTLCIWSWWCENRISMKWFGEKNSGRCKIKHFRFNGASFNVLPLYLILWKIKSIKIIENNIIASEIWYIYNRINSRICIDMLNFKSNFPWKHFHDRNTRFRFYVTIWFTPF